MENEVKRDEMLEDDPKPMKTYLFDLSCKFELKAESKPDAIIIAVEQFEGIQITNIQKIECQEKLEGDR